VRSVAVPCHLWTAFGSPASLRGAIASALVNFGALSNRLNPFSLAPLVAEVHQGPGAALSCRLYLTACNLRQIDAGPALRGARDAR